MTAKRNSTRREFLKTSGLIAGTPVFINPFTGWLGWDEREEIQDPATGLARLRCEYLVNPLGIDTVRPRFSWEINDSRRGLIQMAFRILVASTPGLLNKDQGDLWDTGRVISDETLHIEYTGKPLTSGMLSWWKLKIWSTALGSTEQECAWSKPALFSIGLLDETDWKAQWITTPEFIPDTPAHVGYMSQIAQNEKENKWVQIDLGSRKRFDGVRLFPAVGRRGKVPPGGEIPPGDGFPQRFKIEISESEDMGNSSMVADYSDKDVENPGKGSFLARFEETSGRYVRLTALRHHNFVPFQGRNYLLKLAQMEVLLGEQNLSIRCEASALDSVEDLTEGYGISLLTNGKREYDAGSRRIIRPAPLLRGEFECNKPVKRAMAYATALGNYELFINGSLVSDDCLSPGYYQYDKRVAVQAYDVTDSLQKGKNAAGAVLADGWYRSRYRLDGYDQFKDFVQGRFGDAVPRFLMQINIEYDDGTIETVGTGKTWTYTLEGPYRRTSMYDGVEYDARREMKGWNTTGFRDKSWSYVAVSVPAWKPILWPATVQSMRKVKEFKPVSIKNRDKGTLLVDFGQGLGGSCRLRLNGPEGTRVKLRHVMALNPDGSLYTRSLWGAFNSGDVFTLNGKAPQTFEAPFTFHGFRYVEVSGLDSESNLEEITALMVSDNLTQTASLETSDIRLNALWKSILFTYQSCLKSAMADVADRDERWGWMGDCGTVHTQSLAYAFDVPAYFRKRCLDLLDDQWDEGYFPAKSPEMEGGGPSAVWSDGALTMAWTSWLNYGDKRLLQQVYPALRKYILLLKSKYETGKPLWPFHFGDWLASQMTISPGATEWKEKGAATIKASLMQRINLISISHLYRSISDVLGEGNDKALMDEFIAKLMQDPEILNIRGKSPEAGAQTAYALSLGWSSSVPDEKQLLTDKLLKAIDAYGGNVTTGTVSTNTLLKVLSDNGNHALAYKLAMKPEFPSFGFMVDHGATVLWERFDTWIPGMGFNPDPMNGINHMGFGSVAEWIFLTTSGIIPLEEGPAYRRFKIEPRMEGSVNNVNAQYHSVNGIIRCQWKKEKGKVSLEVVIPPGSIALVRIPATDATKVKEGNSIAGKSEGVTCIGFENGIASFEVQSGSYAFYSMINS